MASCVVYKGLAEFVGHVEQESGYYNIYRGWTDYVGWVQEEGGDYTVYQAGVECIGRIRREGPYYKIQNLPQVDVLCGSSPARRWSI
jgi:hypothetical protein